MRSVPVLLLAVVVLAAGADGYALSPLERAAAEEIALKGHTEAGNVELGSGIGRGLLSSEEEGSEWEEARAEVQVEEMLDSSPKTTKGKGFKIPFYPGNSTVFNPQKSKTFRVVPKQMFLLGYADNTHLKGYQGRDVVQIGDHFVDTKFGAITDCNSPDFNGVDGIVGFGMPVQHQAAPPPPSGMAAMMPGGGGDKPQPTLPLPLLFALTDPRVKDNAHNHMLKNRAFSFMSTDKDAEIQLGGYDPDAVDGRMFLTPSITVNDYVVVSLSLKFGDTELFDFTPKNPRLRYLPAIMDSGTSCLVIPDSTMNGLLKESPYDRWKGMVGDTKHPKLKSTFHLNIAGATFDIGYDDWYLTLSNQSCVQKAPPGFGGILVGDVLFRRYVVLFDLRHYPESVVIGIGKQNPHYKPAKHHHAITKVPAYKRKPLNISDSAPPRYKAPMATDRIPIWNQEETQYFINLTLGSPRQKFTVIFDTGSSVFGIFSRCIPNAPSYGTCVFGGGSSGGGGMLIEGAVFVLSIAVIFCGIGTAINLYVRKRHDKQEQLARSKARGKNPSNSSYGPERLAGMYGTMP
eukprot:CAMPEP_0169453540 /NCGR_PEP_ID=MMETSP1042-20121227/14812_1 /TAXON_ID=464988 /ORGANISM="Hemiselmis andersenii, Strain CCMP1180" /LENGTH=571 /DNA_ID=CAMNT_0009565579 /DNA_START=32 /DNA_END=1747 /DNA_ORIENTATION=-